MLVALLHRSGVSSAQISALGNVVGDRSKARAIAALLLTEDDGTKCEDAPGLKLAHNLAEPLIELSEMPAVSGLVNSLRQTELSPGSRNALVALI